MDWLELVYTIGKVCLIPLVGILSAYLIKWLNAKEIEVLDKVDNDTADKYIAMLFDTITICVSATSQTYVESLKKQNKFDLEAQKVAFQMSYDAVMAALTEEAKIYLATIYGDLNAFIATKIEAEVKAQK
jgi:hypothetical protein